MVTTTTTTTATTIFMKLLVNFYVIKGYLKAVILGS
jgi:hypothetical protein